MGQGADDELLRRIILAGARVHGEHPYLEDARSDRVLSYVGLHHAVERWAAALEQAVIPSDGVVLLDIGDPLEFAAAFVGIIAAGRCAAPVDPSMPDGELARSVAALAPAALASDNATRPDLGLARVAPAKTTNGPHHAPTGPGRVRLRTSGSTGEPKIVELTERQLLHVARSVADHNKLAATDRGYNALPLFHINAEVVGLLATLVAGATLVLDRRFRRDGFWPLIAQREVTWINAVPAILAILSRSPIPTRPGPLRFIRSASAALPDVVRGTLLDALGDVVVESYGMTEAASQITATALDERAPAGSAGRPVGVELRIQSETGETVATDEVGRIQIRGAGVISSYVGGRDADRFTEGWLDTGDLGRIDAAGYLFLVGRVDDVINRGGEMIYPREVEEVLLQEPRVLDAVVVGRPDDILGFVPVAYVIAREAAQTAAETAALVADLKLRCSEHLSRFKRPADVIVVDELPRAATGKIRRHQVRELAAAGSGRG